MNNTWKTLSTREIYKNKWIRLREDQVITPAGQRGIYGVVETYPAVGIVPITENLDTYLVGQYRYALNTYSWEIPEGGGMDNEKPEETAKRELLEETGLSALKWTFLDTLYTSNSFMDETGYIFLAEELTIGTSSPEHTEELQVIRIPFIDAYKKVIDYKIKDALAVIGILRAYHHLKEKGRL